MIKSMDYISRYATATEHVIKEVSDDDHVFLGEGKNEALYHSNGLSGLRAIILNMISFDIELPQSFMDFGCAYGRVLRYFKAAFPETELTACDVRTDAIRYCSTIFGAKPVLSSAVLNEISFPDNYDIIWMGSVITHFSSENSKIILAKALEHLNDGGLLVFSLHGRIYPLDVQPNRWKLLEDESFGKALEHYNEKGFGYHDYPGRPGIGASLTKPSWVFDFVEDNPNLTMAYQERGWTGWHDVAAITKGPQKSYFSTYKDRPF